MGLIGSRFSPFRQINPPATTSVAEGKSIWNVENEIVDPVPAPEFPRSRFAGVGRSRTPSGTDDLVRREAALKKVGMRAAALMEEG
jgi:hypothetical protein